MPDPHLLLVALLSAVVGALLAGALACVPSLHIYNILGLLVLAAPPLGHAGVLAPEAVVPLFAGMIVGWAMLNTIPSILLAAPDESAMFTVLPGQAYLMRGRGYEAVMITTLGGLGGIAVMVPVAGFLAPRWLPVVRTVMQPHFHWMIWTVIAFMLMSEWPKAGMTGQGGWRKFGQGWAGLGMGLATFALSGLLGFILMYRSPLSPDRAFQNLMPAFVGLFALPSLIMNLLSRVEVPPQYTPRSVGLNGYLAFKGIAAGVLGGGFAAFVPAVTGGVGGMLAGHATAQRDERVFLVSQGASKVVYYAGGFMLFFVPGLHLSRGGGAWLFRGLGVPAMDHAYGLVLASMAIAGAVSFLLAGPLTRGTLHTIGIRGHRVASWISLVLMIILVLTVTGAWGLWVMCVGMGIGLLPLLFGARRMNCLGIILVPVACNMSGVGAAVAAWLGLV